MERKRKKRSLKHKIKRLVKNNSRIIVIVLTCLITIVLVYFIAVSNNNPGAVEDIPTALINSNIFCG
jgi:lipopolysaccharide/colanic/teichoic acid biosynthesis glycosyltransferase